MWLSGSESPSDTDGALLGRALSLGFPGCAQRYAPAPGPGGAVAGQADSAPGVRGRPGPSSSISSLAPSPSQGHRPCLFPGPTGAGRWGVTCSLPPPPQKHILGFLRGPAAWLFWRPLHTLVPKSTPSALGEAALCQQAEWRCEGSHSGQGGGWAGPHCSAGNENTTRPLQPLTGCLFPFRVPTACPPPGPGRESRATGHRPGLNLAPASWTRSWGPCTTCPGRKSRWRTGAGGKQTMRPVQGRQEQAWNVRGPTWASALLIRQVVRGKVLGRQ